MTTAINSIGNSIGSFIQSENRAPRLVKSAATTTAIGLAVIGSVALVFSSPITYGVATLGVGTIQLLTISKLLKHADSPLGRVALTASFITLGALSLAGPSVLSYILLKGLITSHSLTVMEILFTSFALTGLLGYGVSTGTQFLRKAFDIMTDSASKERIELLAQKLRELPASDLESNLQFATLSALHNPEYLVESFKDRKYYNRTAEGARLTLRVMHPEYTLNEFKSNISALQILDTWFAQLNQLSPAQRRQVETVMRLDLTKEEQKIKDEIQNTLGVLRGEELKEATNILLEKIAILADILTTDEFNQLLQEPVLQCLNQRMNRFSNDFVNSLESISGSFIRIQNELIALERDMNNPPRLPGEFEKRLGEIQDQFQKNRQLLDALNKERQGWQNILNAGMTTPNFPTPALQALLGDEALKLRLSRLNRESIGVQTPGNPETAFTILQRLTSRLGAQNQDQVEESAWEFLGTNRCDFRVPEYEEIRQWLKVTSLADIESKFEELDLKTEKDLYRHQILPEVGIVEKETIKRNLKQYIELKLSEKMDLRTRAYSLLSSASRHLTPTGTLDEKVSKAFYRVATMIMILVPIYLCPLAAAVGIGVGGLFYILRKFNVWGTATLEELFSGFTRQNDLEHLHFHIEGWLLNAMISGIAGRRFFTLTPTARKNMEIFAQSNLFAKLRILNAELGITLLTSTFGIFLDLLNPSRRNTAGGHADMAVPGAFVQGVALAYEIANLT